MSRDGKYLATAGDRLVKMWDYHMRLDINFQVSKLVNNLDIGWSILFLQVALPFVNCIVIFAVDIVRLFVPEHDCAQSSGTCISSAGLLKPLK